MLCLFLFFSKSVLLGFSGGEGGVSLGSWDGGVLSDGPVEQQDAMPVLIMKLIFMSQDTVPPTWRVPEQGESHPFAEAFPYVLEIRQHSGAR